MQVPADQHFPIIGATFWDRRPWQPAAAGLGHRWTLAPAGKRVLPQAYASPAFEARILLC